MRRIVPLLLTLLTHLACGPPPAPKAAPSGTAAPMVDVSVAPPTPNDPSTSPDATSPTPGDPAPAIEPEGGDIQPKGKGPQSTGGFPFPEAMGWEKQKFQTYPSTAAGVSQGYSFLSVAGHATVYLYDAGLPNIPEDVTSPVVSEQFGRSHAAVVDAGTRGQYKQVTVRGQRLVRVGHQSMHHAHYEIVTHDGHKLGSDLYLFTHRGEFLKIRVSYDERMTKAASVGIEKLLEALVGATARPNRA